MSTPGKCCCRNGLAAAARAGDLLPWVFPFLLFAWALPVVSPVCLGNDYTMYSTPFQMEFLFWIRQGVWPLFIPGFAGGQSAAALTLGQMVHPVTWLAAITPGYWHGYAVHINTVAHLLGLALAHACFYRFLKRASLTRPAALVVSTVAMYNLRTVDLLRYGASAEALSGMVLVCAAVGTAALVERPRPRHWLAVVGATYWLVVSGHPQMMYFGALGSALFALVVPFWLPAIGVRPLPSRRCYAAFELRAALAGGAGALLAAVYIVPFITDYLGTGAGRAGLSYRWAASFADTTAGSLANLAVPSWSDVHGAFGGSCLFLTAFLLPVLLLRRCRIPAGVWAAWGVCVVALLVSQGARLPLHWVFWRWLPFGSVMRVPGRISLVIPLFAALVLGWLLSGPTEGRSGNVGGGTVWPAVVAWALPALLLFAALIPHATTTPYSPVAIRAVPAWLWGAQVAAGALALCASVGVPWRLRWSDGPAGDGLSAAGLRDAILLFGVTAQLLLLLPWSTWVEPWSTTPTYTEMRQQKSLSLEYAHVPGMGFDCAAVRRQMRDGFLEARWLTASTRWRDVDSVDAAFEQLFTHRTVGEAVTVGCGRQGDADGEVSLRVIGTDANTVTAWVSVTQPAVVVLAYPFTGRWRARIDGRETALFPANGLYCGVQVPPGEHTLSFRHHSPGTGFGLWLSVLSAVGILLWYTWAAGRSWSCRRRAASVLVVCVVGAGLGLLGTAFMRRRPALTVRYHWATGQGRGRGLAFQRHTRMSPVASESDAWRHCSARGVDGVIDRTKAFLTDVEDQPTWAVDLGRPCRLSRVVIHDGEVGATINRRPLDVGGSLDDVEWTIFARVDTPPTGGVTSVDLGAEATARFVFVRAAGPGRLSAAEVEIFGTPLR